MKVVYLVQDGEFCKNCCLLRWLVIAFPVLVWENNYFKKLIFDKYDTSLDE